jgi:hypothetical protein
MRASSDRVCATHRQRLLACHRLTGQVPQCEIGGLDFRSILPTCARQVRLRQPGLDQRTRAVLDGDGALRWLSMLSMRSRATGYL